MKKGYRQFISVLIIITVLVNFPSDMVAQYVDYGVIPGKTYLWFNNDKNEVLKETAKPVVLVPPSCGKKRREMGHDLALPFGTGLMFEYSKQFYDASELTLSSDSTGFVASGVANVQNSSVEEWKMTFRPDVWVFPVLNVYGIVGYKKGTTFPDFEVPSIIISNPDFPDLGEIEIDTTVIIRDDLETMGPVYGGGATASAGYRSFFFVADYHYMVAPNSDIDLKETSHTFSVKAGVLLGRNSNKVKWSLWAGSMFVSDKRSFKGQVDVKDILPGFELILGEKATYSGSLTPKKKWNAVTGISMTVNKHHLLAVEAGFLDRKQLTVFYGFRF